MTDEEDITKWIKALEITIKKYRAQELVRIPRHCIEKYYLQDIKCQCALELLKDMQEPDFMECLNAAIEHINETPSDAPTSRRSSDDELQTPSEVEG